MSTVFTDGTRVPGTRRNEDLYRRGRLGKTAAKKLLKQESAARAQLRHEQWLARKAERS